MATISNRGSYGGNSPSRPSWSNNSSVPSWVNPSNGNCRSASSSNGDDGNNVGRMVGDGFDILGSGETNGAVIFGVLLFSVSVYLLRRPIYGMFQRNLAYIHNLVE